MSREELKQKTEKLLVIGDELKKQFIGIDDVIDQVINAIRVWYLMPELMTRPIIINLWGLTGTGKTSMVRKLVQLLQMTDSFVEIQMDVSNGSQLFGLPHKIKTYIERSDVQQDQPSILLLDEIQRFRTIDANGAEIADTKGFQDIWMLLSDGTFQSSSEKKVEIMKMILDDLYYDDSQQLKDNKSEKSSTNKEKTYMMSSWQARSVKKLIDSADSVEEIMKWSDAKRKDELNKALKNDKTFEGESYSKMLIFICGNIDEAYKMANNSDDADTCADVFHEFSKKINIINIKQALSKRFSPEQVARFGNNHIIYPSISKTSYQEIIRQNIEKFCNDVKKIHDIKIIIDNSVYHTIYDNGVFPAQGVRPVLSTLACLFENYTPIFLLKSIEENTKTVKIKYVKSNIVAEINGEEISIPVILTIDKIKQNKNSSERALTSVHEAGHAVVYSIVCKVPPTQIRSSTSSNEKEGFVGVHLIHMNKQFAEDMIGVYLAGQAAEEIVFGENYKSSGAASDIAKATQLAANYVRFYGFDGNQSKILPISYNGAGEANTDFKKTNIIVENLLVEGKKRAIDIINSNKYFFKEIVQKLIDDGEIIPAKFVEIAAKYKISMINHSSETKLIHNYDEKWIQYKDR